MFRARAVIVLPAPDAKFIFARSANRRWLLSPSEKDLQVSSVVDFGNYPQKKYKTTARSESSGGQFYFVGIRLVLN